MTHTPQEVRFGATPKPARETRALPGCGIVRSSRSTVPASGASVCGMRLKSVDFPRRSARSAPPFRRNRPAWRRSQRARAPVVAPVAFFRLTIGRVPELANP